MASLKRVTHKSGRVVYRIVICLGYDKEGNKLVKNLTYSVDQSATPRQQEKEAMKYAMELEDKLKFGHDVRSEKVSFEEFSDQWLESVKENLAYGTYIGYKQLLEGRIQPYFKGYRVAGIRTEDIEAFYRTLAEEDSFGTIRRFANVLSCIFRTARRWNIIENNPCQYAQKPRRRQENGELRYFTPQQSVMFLKSLDLTYEVKYRRRHATENKEGDVFGECIKKCNVPTQYKLFYAISIFCGLRKGETLALRWGDVDLEGREIRVSKSVGRTVNGFDCKEPKSASALRRVPIPNKLSVMLKEYKAEYGFLKSRLGDRWQGDDSLFIQPDGRRMCHTATYQYFVRHLKRYNQWVEENPEKARLKGLERLPMIPLHGLRHSCATLLNYLDVNIIDISRYLGHANCSTTMNIYAHSFEAQKQAASDKLNEFIRIHT